MESYKKTKIGKKLSDVSKSSLKLTFTQAIKNLKPNLLKSPKPARNWALYREADLNCRPSGYESDALTS